MAPSRFIRSLLTYGTKERGAAVLRDAPHDAGAAPGRAAPALAVVDAEPVLKAPELAVGAAMVAQRGAAGRDGILEHGLDRRDEAFRMRRRRAGAGRQCRGFAARREARAVERFADVDVAEPGHGLLVEQGGLWTRRFPGAGMREPFRREGAVERLGTDPHQRMVFELGARNQQHESEPARVVER